MTAPSTDFFHDAYNRDDIAYGLDPSGAITEYLRQVGLSGGHALDLGAGAGRDSLALARAGYQVKSVDMSPRGIERIIERASEIGVDDRITPVVADVREIDFPVDTYDAIIATTVLDHIPADDAETVWRQMAASLTHRGVLYVQVHTTEDPGSGQLPGSEIDAPISETADAVINYFQPNQLVSWACHPEADLRVLRYEERREWDETHGDPHQHGKAILLAVRSGHFPDWYGQPPAFPKSNSNEIELSSKGTETS
ncbi:MAG: class I SAM-dependent methyltransferase [Planctomycetota bacterium]